MDTGSAARIRERICAILRSQFCLLRHFCVSISFPFVGIGSFLTHYSALPQLLYYVTIPVHRNAQLLEPPTQSKRWPVMVFSHGLGGSRNAYSHLLGSLSSHGIVVIAPDHRDGSSPITYIRATEESEAKAIDYNRIPHTLSPEIFEERDEQLKIRLWELGLIYDALLKIDNGSPIKNLDPNQSSRSEEHNEILSMFRDMLDVHQPGSISWGGHSFGGATMIQFVKSTFYNTSPGEKEDYVPLFTPSKSSNIVHQITPTSPVVLLDMWCMPLQSPSTKWLRDKPMPCYSPSGPGGTVLLAVLSEVFFKWRAHLQETKRVLSEAPASDTPVHTKSGPRFFYRINSAHLSQSDFGILFPWVTTNILGAKEPERTLRLNVRAILQVLRDAGIKVADTSRIDMEEEKANLNEVAASEGKNQDWKILDTRSDSVRGWVALTTDPDPVDDAEETEKVSKSPNAAVVEGEVLGEIIKGEGL